MNRMKQKILLSFLILTLNCANASLFWNINVGINEFKKENYIFAKDYFISYLNNNPNDYDGNWWLAKTYQKLHDNKSKDLFKKSYELASKEKALEKVSFKTIDTIALEDYFDMAAMYFEQGDFKNADNYADLMLKISPKSPSAFFIKSKIKYTTGDNKKAKEYLNQAILYNNEILDTNLAKNLEIKEIPQTSKEMYSTFAYEAYFLGDIENAIKYTKKCLSLDDSNTSWQNLLIDLYIKNNDLANAQLAVETALKTNPSNIEALLYKAKIKQYENDFDIESILFDCYKINPNNQNVLLELGDYYLYKNDFKKSKQYFETLISVNSELYEAYFGYIYSLIELGELSNALKLIDEASVLNPDSSEVYFLRGKISEYQGDFKDALYYYKEAVSIDENPNYLLQKAKLEYIQKDYENSLTDLIDISQIPYSAINTQDIDNYIVKNFIKLKDTKNAKDYINKNNLLDKNELIYKYNLYTIYKIEDNKEKAREFYPNINKIKAQNTSDYITLSEIFLEEKGRDSAIKILDEGIKKFPDNYELKVQKIKINYMSQQ